MCHGCDVLEIYNSSQAQKVFFVYFIIYFWVNAKIQLFCMYRTLSFIQNSYTNCVGSIGEGRNGLAFFNNSTFFNNLTFNFCGL